MAGKDGAEPTRMGGSLTYWLDTARRGVPPRAARRILAGYLGLHGVFLVTLAAFSPTGDAGARNRMLAAGLSALVPATCLALTPRRLESSRHLPALMAAALGLGTAAAVLVTGGAGGPLNLTVPMTAFFAAAVLTPNMALVVAALSVFADLVGTIALDNATGRNLYELVEAAMVTAVVLTGTLLLRSRFAGDSGRLEQHNAALHQHVKELVAVNEVARLVGLVHRLEDLLQQGLELSLATLGYDAGCVFIADEEERRLTLRASIGLPADLTAAVAVQNLTEGGRGLAAEAARAGRPVITADLADAPSAGFARAERAVTDLAHASAVSVPMFVGGRLTGVIQAVSSQGRQPAEHDLRVLETVAAELGQAIKRQEQADKVEWQRRQLEVLHGIARKVTASLRVEEVLDFATSSAAELMAADAAYLATVDPHTGNLRIVSHHGFVTRAMDSLEIARGRGIGGRVVEDGQVHQSADYCDDTDLEDDYKQVVATEGLVTIMGAPLVSRDTVVGVLYAARRVRHRFTSEEAQILSMLGSQVAIALENARLFEKVRQQSIRDPLTGAFNRRFFAQRLSEEAERARRYDHPVSLLILDVDDFKAYNDTYGHSRGDEVLKHLVDIATETVRATDVVARHGGEEFVVLLPETDADQAAAVAYRLHQAIGTQLAWRAHSPRKLSVSMGVATLRGAQADPQRLLEGADAALYRAKRAGKDMVWVGDATSQVTTEPTLGYTAPDGHQTANVYALPRTRPGIFYDVSL